MKQLVDQLVDEQVSVTSYAVGPRLDTILLGALANHTGGAMVVDGDNISDREAGVFLAAAAHETVLWVRETKLPSEFHRSLSESLPAFAVRSRNHFDRPCQASRPVASCMRPSTRVAIRPRCVGRSKPPRRAKRMRIWLISCETQQKDGGLGLPLVGTAGLAEMRRLVRVEGRALVRLGQQAVATGALDQAETLAAQALKLDSGDPEALAIRDAVVKARKAGPRTTGRDLKLVNFQAGRRSESRLRPAPPRCGTADGDFLEPG